MIGRYEVVAPTFQVAVERVLRDYPPHCHLYAKVNESKSCFFELLSVTRGVRKIEVTVLQEK